MHKLKYDVAQMKFSELKERIKIPMFQRGLVWGEEKKAAFIDSLKAGLPIGTLLLSKSPDGGFLVVDGLQRFTTMLKYSKTYFEYFKDSELTTFDIESILAASESAFSWYGRESEQNQATTREKIRKILGSTIRESQGKNQLQIAQTAAKRLCREIALLNEKDEMLVINPVYIIVNRFETDAKIDDIEIPLIIFDGSSEELAIVFQKVNQEGVKLSKYDVYAATWSNYTVNVKGDRHFIEHIIKKYDASQEDSGLEIFNYDPENIQKTGELTPYEYAFALGKELIEKCPVLFGVDEKTAQKQEAKIESIGFVLLAELLGLSYQQMGGLAKQMKKYEECVSFTTLKEAIVETAKSVQTALADYIVAPTKQKRSLACHSELQLVSYVVVLFKLRYDLTPEKGLNDKGKKAKALSEVRKYLYKHYLYDILRGFWSGSGDSKLREIVADPATCRYTRDVSKDGMEQILSEWLSSYNKRASLISVSAETKLVLNYLLRFYEDHAKIVGTDYDVEHCVPKKVLQDHLIKKNKNAVIPISAPCNLIYIPKSENRSKGEKTYYQRQAEAPGTYTLNEEALSDLSYPTKSELRFVNSTETLTVEAYSKFLEDREKYVTRKMMEKMYP